MGISPNFDFSLIDKGAITPQDIIAEIKTLGAQKKRKEGLRETYTGADLYNNKAEKIQCLIGEIIPSVGLFAIGGSSDTGKSMFFRQMAIDIAQGGNFLGFNINARHKKVLFISSEDDDRATSFLIWKQAPSIEKLENIRFYFDCENIPNYINDQLEIEPVDLVIIDAWGDVFGENLNDTTLLRKALNTYKQLSIKHECAIGFLHHTGKRTQKLAPSKDNLLSGQGFEAKMRLVLELRTDEADEDVKHLCVVKGNYLGKEFKQASYKLTFDPENFAFTNTGERVPFDTLTQLTENGREKKVPLLKASEVDPFTHKDLLTEVFKPNPRLKLGELETRFSSVYEKKYDTVFGGKRVTQYLDYLLNDLGLISKKGVDRSPKTYYHLTTDHHAGDGNE